MTRRQDVAWQQIRWYARLPTTLSLKCPITKRTKRCLTAMPETGHLTFTAVFSDRWYKRLLIRLSGTACRGTKHSGRTCDARYWGVMSQVIFGDIVGHFNVSSLLRSTDLKLIRRIISEIKDMTLAPGRSGDKPQNSTLEP